MQSGLRSDALPLLPTTLVGSYPQPESDRSRAAGRARRRGSACANCARRPAVARAGPGRCHGDRDPDQERAGIEHRDRRRNAARELLESFRATALEGLDLERRNGHEPERSARVAPRVVGRIRRSSARSGVEFLRAHQSPDQDHGPRAEHHDPAVPQRFLSNQRRTGPRLRGRRQRRDPGSVRGRRDVVQIDEPYMQARPDEARAWGSPH